MLKQIVELCHLSCLITVDMCMSLYSPSYIKACGSVLICIIAADWGWTCAPLTCQNVVYIYIYIYILHPQNYYILSDSVHRPFSGTQVPSLFRTQLLMSFLIIPLHEDVIKWKHFPRYCPFEFTGPRWIPHTKASDAELWWFLWSASV